MFGPQYQKKNSINFETLRIQDCHTFIKVEQEIRRNKLTNPYFIDPPQIQL